MDLHKPQLPKISDKDLTPLGITDLIKKANRCDQDKDKAYKDKPSYEIPEDLKFKQDRLAKIKAAKQALNEREEQLNPGKGINDKKQISFVATKVRIMGKKDRFDYAYNAQISVDADLQIIVAQHVSQSGNDKQELAIQDTAGRLPEQLSTNNGYFSGDNLQALEQSSIDTYIATESTIV
ncbi:hypothetical protein [Methylobacter psychrophilus]|uniref:hypothetical protein n=1 Tax=Methylobacter psychrophilus TaxID=96941 RepID=UPI0021D51BFF|nr:hypothetical protein [Methylobacter psychrophilus]